MPNSASVHCIIREPLTSFAGLHQWRSHGNFLGQAPAALVRQPCYSIFYLRMTHPSVGRHMSEQEQEQTSVSEYEHVCEEGSKYDPQILHADQSIISGRPYVYLGHIETDLIQAIDRKHCENKAYHAPLTQSSLHLRKSSPAIFEKGEHIEELETKEGKFCNYTDDAIEYEEGFFFGSVAIIFRLLSNVDHFEDLKGVASKQCHAYYKQDCLCLCPTIGVVGGGLALQFKQHQLHFEGVVAEDSKKAALAEDIGNLKHLLI